MGFFTRLHVYVKKNDMMKTFKNLLHLYVFSTFDDLIKKNLHCEKSYQESAQKNKTVKFHKNGNPTN